MGQDELAYVRKLRKAGKLDKAEELLLKGKPTRGVLDELRKTASARAHMAKKNMNWVGVARYLEEYTAYAEKWREHCITTSFAEPPTHTKSDKLLLEEAKKKSQS